MDVLFICRDARADSLASNLLMALEARKAGMEVGVMFTSEALEAVAEGSFRWPPGLTGMHLRLRMADNARGMGLPIKGGSGQGREFNPGAMLRAAQEEGVSLYACESWSNLLNLKNKLPEGFGLMDLPATLRIISETNNVIGSL